MSTVAEPDAEDPAEPVHLSISIPEDPSLGDAEILPPPFTAEETRALRDAFSWEAMTPLRETDREGRPILHYTLVYVTSREAHEALTQLDLHHSYLPLFESERARWDGTPGVFTHEGDGRGVFAFALLPAALINAERTLALAGEPAFDAILVREVPEAAARARDGGVSYEWLRSEGFLYNGRAYVPPVSTGDSDVGGTREALLGGLLNRFVRAMAGAIGGLIDIVRRSLFGAADIAANGSVRINVLVTPLNTDPSFVAGSPMRQGWGANRGSVLRIKGQPIRVSQGISLFLADSDANGLASMLVVRDKHAMVCVQSEAPAAFVTRGILPASLCAAAVTPRATAGMFVNLQIRAIEMNVLAQIDDARDYVGAVHGYAVHQPKVAIGGVADVVTVFNGGRAFAPCFDLPLFPPADVMVAIFSDIIDATVGIPTTALAAEFLLDYDIFIPTTNGDRSRGVPTHEYGHFVMCDMLNEESAYASTWVPMVIEGLAQGRADTASQLNEAFADFVSSQVTGSVNAFQTEVARAPRSGNMDLLAQQWWCDPRSSVCVDDNIGGPPLSALAPLGQVATTAEVIAAGGLDPFFIQRTARMMTTIADAFDGQASAGDVPGNGAAWTLVAPNVFVPPVTDSLALLDESVTLAAAPGFRGHGSDLRDVVHEFTETSGGRLDVQFFRAMTRVMRTAAFTDTEICELYALHDPTGTCPRAFFDTPPDIVPSAPVDLIHTLVAPNTATWTWRDVSPVAGVRFNFEVRDESGLILSGALPYVRTQTLTRSVLPHYDRGIVFRVQTVSPSMGLSAWTEDRFQSLAEPARGLRTTGAVPGQLPLLWTGVRASNYGVVVTDARGRSEVARVTEPRYTLERFDGGAIRVEIVSYNSENVASTPSAPLVLASTLAAPVLHVAPAPEGDDTADGGPTTPFATIGAALARAGTLGVATIHVAGDLYVSDALTIPRGVIVQIAGGYAFPSWSRPNSLTRIRMATATVGLTIFRGCAATDGTWAAGIRVKEGAQLYLDQIGLTAFPSDTKCNAAVELDSAGLDLRAAEIAVNVGGGGNCAVGVLGANVTSEPLTFAARKSRVSGAEKLNVADLEAQVAAVCLVGARSVVLEDSSLIGIATDPGAVIRAKSAAGLILTQARSADIVRSFIATTSPTARAIEGMQNGVILRELVGSARLANSVVRTARGSDRNFAISVHGVFGSGNLSLFYVTALAGDDYDRRDPLALDHRSAPVALAGALNAVRILNSILANGAGLGEPGLQTVIAGIDRSTAQMTADPRSFEMRGTAISFPFRDPSQSEALTFCFGDGSRFRGGLYIESDLNFGSFHRCYPIAGAGSYVASGNLAFNGDRDDVSGLTRPAARFDSEGRPRPSAVLPPLNTIAIDTLRAAGVDLFTEPVADSSSLTRDLGNTIRLRAPPGAGAWVLP